MAELDRVRITAMLAANAALELRLCRATFLDGHIDELTDTRRIERLERVAEQNLLPQIVRQERVDVVAAETERHLRQVVCAKTEEVGIFSDFVGCEAGPRNLDHRTDR